MSTRKRQWVQFVLISGGHGLEILIVFFSCFSHFHLPFFCVRFFIVLWLCVLLLPLELSRIISRKELFLELFRVLLNLM